MRRRRTTSRARRWLEALLLVAGLTGLGIWGWSHLRTTLFQKQAERALERKIETRRPVPPPPKLENGALVGRLVIPRLKMQSVVREGAGEDTLAVALGHIPGTALPGQNGNVGIAGHRDTLFRGLRHIEKDDLIELQTPSGNYSYHVEQTAIVKPQDVSVLRPDGHSQITLVTCYPFYYVGSAPDRFIVKARLENTPAPAPEVTAQAPAAPPSAAPSPVAPAPPPAAAQPAPPRPSNPRPRLASARREPAVRRVNFRVSASRSTQLAPGITLGLSSTDSVHYRATGWMRLAQSRRTIWLRNQAAYHPVLFHSYDDSRQAELMITQVTRNDVAGYLLLFGGKRK